MRWLLLAALVLAALPGAQAALGLTVDFPDAELTPGVDQATATLHVSLDCQQALLRARASNDFVAVPVKLVGHPAVVASGNPVANLPLQQCREGESNTEVLATFAVGVLSTAAAHRALGFNVTAELPADVPTLAPAESQTVPLSAKAKALLIVTVVQVPQAIHVTQANQTFVLRLANKGNTPVHVVATPVFSSPLVHSSPAAADLGTDVLAGSGPSTTDLAFAVASPTLDKLPEFTGHLDIVAHAIEGGTADQSMRADLFFRNEVPAPKSSPAAPTVLVGLALLGLARARRRP